MIWVISGSVSGASKKLDWWGVSGMRGDEVNARSQNAGKGMVGTICANMVTLDLTLPLLELDHLEGGGGILANAGEHSKT